jgi:hypothetical protein
MARNQQVQPLRRRSAPPCLSLTPPPPPSSAIDSIQIDNDLGAFVASLSAVSVLKSDQQQAEEP